jgi:hypothetical protein
MAVEKAIMFDDLQKGDDDERREGFFSGGQGRSRRGGMRGGRRGGTTRGGRRGGRSARGAGMRSAQNRAKAARAKSSKQGQTRRGTTTTSKAVSSRVAQNKSISRRQQGQVSTPQAAVSAAPESTTKSTQGQTRRGSTTTPQAVAKERAAIANVQGTKYSKQLSDAIRAANQRAFDKSLEGRKLAAAQAAVAQNPNLRAGTLAGDIAARAEVARMDAARGSLLDKAKRNQISTAELARLADLNQAIGLNPTTGMGLVESMRFNTKDVNLGDIAKLAGFVANPVGSVVSAALTGGQGILGTLKDAGQTAFAGLTGQDAPKSGSLFGNLGLGNLMDRFKNIDIGPAAPTPPDRGGRRDERMMAQMPPVPPIPAARPFDPRRIKKAVTPVGTAVTDQAMNEYLKLAGLA